jgi:hypothetical protein
VRPWLFLLALSACSLQNQAPGGYCSSDSDCGGGSCTRAQLCSTSAAALTVHWTINGTAPTLTSPGGCTSIGDLRLDIAFKTGGSLLRYAPVPCAAAQTRIDNLPLEQLTMVGLQAVDHASVAAQTTRDAVTARADSPTEYDVTLALTN